jgi:hypothetical protein
MAKSLWMGGVATVAVLAVALAGAVVVVDLHERRHHDISARNDGGA